MNSKKIKNIILLILFMVIAGGLYYFAANIPIINKITQNSQDPEHDYRPVFDEEGQIDYWTCVMHPSIRLEKTDQCPICGMESTPVYKKGNFQPETAENKFSDEADKNKDGEDMSGIKKHDDSRIGVVPGKANGSESKSKFTVSPERQQLIGVKTQTVAYRQLDKEIRTVGIVEMDETKIEHIHTKIDGWIDRVFVDYTWQHVMKGDPLFTIYSPKLVSTQEEYLLALKSEKLLENSEFPEISEAGKSLLNSSRRRLELWDISDEQIRELEKSGKVKKSLVIYSPISGHVMKKNVYENQYVKPEEMLYVIADHSTVWVQVDIYENERPLIKLGDTAIMTLTSFPGEEFKGEVTFISPHIDQKTRTIKVRLEFDNPDLKLLPEMYANVNLLKPMGEKLTIPESALLRTGKQDIVFVSKGDGVMQIRNVMVGQKAGGYYEVMKGLNEGEEVVSRANFLIDSESKVQAAVATWGDDSTENNGSKMKMNNNVNNDTDQNLELYPEAIPKENEEMNHNQHMH